MDISKFKSIVRRLTPVECQRLMGFPDDYLDIGDGKGCANPPNINLPKFAAVMELARKTAEREEAAKTTIQTEIDF